MFRFLLILALAGCADPRDYFVGAFEGKATVQITAEGSTVPDSYISVLYLAVNRSALDREKVVISTGLCRYTAIPTDASADRLAFEPGTCGWLTEGCFGETVLVKGELAVRDGEDLTITTSGTTRVTCGKASGKASWTNSYSGARL